MRTIRTRSALVAAAMLALLAGTPAGAVHDGVTTCSLTDGDVRLRLAPEHTVYLVSTDGSIGFHDLSDSSEGSCGGARGETTDRILVSEISPGRSRLQFDQELVTARGASTEASGLSELEVRLGTVTQLWIMGRPGADRITVGERGINLNADDDRDITGHELREVTVYLNDGNDRFSAAGGSGTGEIWRRFGVVVSGGGGYDVLAGSARGDILDGGSENDRVYGGAGRDEISGGTLLVGGGGADVISAEGAPADVLAGPGDDLILANDSGADDLNGGTGTDRAFLDQEDTTSSIETRTYGNP